MPQQLGLLEQTTRPSGCDPSDVVIRPSARAKRLTLRVVPPSGVELVVPRCTRPRAVEEFLATHRGWITRAVDELRARYPQEHRHLPSRIALPAIDRQWSVDIETLADARATLRDHGDRLELRARAQCDPAAFELLRVWLLRQGRAHLKPWLLREADRVGLKPASVQIRTQRTRWGSCSRRGGISLNAALLLLPASLVRYLFIHELCHLRHLDHSARYWRLVERLEPEYRARDRALSAAWCEVPLWALSRAPSPAG